tara:strand:- start:33 stop:380 length:348 start_codon:yes stop_codon:yes gene_type:complete
MNVLAITTVQKEVPNVGIPVLVATHSARANIGDPVTVKIHSAATKMILPTNTTVTAIKSGAPASKTTTQDVKKKGAFTAQRLTTNGNGHHASLDAIPIRTNATPQNRLLYNTKSP